MMSKIQTIAMYLPQFHRIPENDAWWGKGYTEWTAVREATPLFSEHMQPKVPKDGDYYNLLEKKTMSKQAEYMKNYGIDGLCFYHYYFKDGYKIMEKPADNLLVWKEIDMPFCFCWANESWARTWSNVKNKNSWAPQYETDESKKETGILVEQKYGREKEWEEHFYYLLPFFQDERYLKRNGMPIFLIHKPNDIPCLYQMTDYWRELARKQGISNIYFIGSNVTCNKKGLDAVLLNAPGNFFNRDTLFQKANGVKTYPYEAVWESIIDAKSIEGIKTYFGGIVNFDDTPRHGKKGHVMTGFSINAFKKYLYRLFQKNLIMGNDYVFLNAWNEWGEGMYLEPDEQYGFQYLEAVKEAKQKAVSDRVDRDNIWSACVKADQEISLESALGKKTLMVYFLDSWMSLRENGINLADYLMRHRYKKIAIYGMGILGRHLLFDLERSDVSVAYIIDRRSELKHQRLEIKSIESDLDPVDAIVVTAVADFDAIYEKLKRKVNCPILSFEELIQEV